MIQPYFWGIRLAVREAYIHPNVGPQWVYSPNHCAKLMMELMCVMSQMDTLRHLHSRFWPDSAGSSPPPLLVLSRWAVSVKGWGAHLLCVAAVETSWSFPSPPGWMGGRGPLKFSRWLAGFCTATSPPSASASTSLFCLCRGTTWSMLYPCHRAEI